MIKEFNIRNFMSFKDQTDFTMEADLVNVSELEDHYVSIGKDNPILKVASIYGPNASGKSNFISALLYLKKTIKSGTKQFRDDNYGNFILKRKVSFENFKFTNELDNTIGFEIVTINKKYEIVYKLEIEEINDGNVIIAAEEMKYKSIDEENFRNVFTRINQKITLAPDFQEKIPKLNLIISNEVTLVRLLETLFVSDSNENLGVLDVIYHFTKELSKITVINNNEQIRGVRVLDLSRLEKPLYKDSVIKTINNMGIRISDIIIKKNDGENPEVFFERTLEDGNSYLLPFDNESDGTKKLIELLLTINTVIKREGTLVIDEIDVHFHPKLIKEIINIFTDDKNQNSQLIFTSHDILNMNKENFRRDEIWFVVKEDNFKSELFALTDIVNYKGEKVRKDAKFSKQYLEGRYGADPFISKGVYWDE